MSDLVKRAREMGGFDPAVELCSEMADEIERLRATLDQTRRFALSGEMDTLVSDEIERLREEKRQMALKYLTAESQWIEETGRLREALREIVKHSDYDDPVRDMGLAALGEEE